MLPSCRPPRIYLLVGLSPHAYMVKSPHTNDLSVLLATFSPSTSERKVDLEGSGGLEAVEFGAF